MGVMGSGIAKQIVSLYPIVLRVDKNYKLPVRSRNRLGHFSSVWVDGPSGRLLVINLYGQHRFGRGLMTDYSAFEKPLMSIINQVSKAKKSYKVGLPYGIGAGYAGGDWSTIFHIIKKASSQFNQDIYLYELQQ